MSKLDENKIKHFFFYAEIKIFYFPTSHKLYEQNDSQIYFYEIEKLFCFLFLVDFPQFSLFGFFDAVWNSEKAWLNNRTRNWKTIKNIIFKLIPFCYRLVCFHLILWKGRMGIKLWKFDFCKINTIGITWNVLFSFRDCLL